MSNLTTPGSLAAHGQLTTVDNSAGVPAIVDGAHEEVISELGWRDLRSSGAAVSQLAHTHTHTTAATAPAAIALTQRYAFARRGLSVGFAAWPTHRGPPPVST